jgi:KipI family sensor histidine kinase inhibitor
MATVEPLGDRAFLARFDTEPEAASWAAGVRERRWAEVVDVVPAYRSVAVVVDPDRVAWDEFAMRLRALSPLPQGPYSRRLVELPVLYDGEDLPDVAHRAGLVVAEVIAAHSGCDYTVFAIGFLPGFPYAGYLPPGLAGQPRLDAPRTRVPAGSVAIAGRQTGVYPADSPGGWRLLGRTPLAIVDLARGHFPIRAGDQLRFRPIERHEFEARRGELLA